MTAYDWIMLALVALGALWGGSKGFTLQLATGSSIVLGYLFARPVAQPIAALLTLSAPMGDWIALGLGYVLISLGVFLAANLFRTILRKANLKDWDRHLGTIVGAMAGVALGLSLTLAAIAVAPSSRSIIQASPSGQVADRLIELLRPSLPEPVRQVVDPLAPSASPAPVETRSTLVAPPWEETSTPRFQELGTQPTSEDSIRRAVHREVRDRLRREGNALLDSLISGDQSPASSRVPR